VSVSAIAVTVGRSGANLPSRRGKWRASARRMGDAPTEQVRLLASPIRLRAPSPSGEGIEQIATLPTG